MSKLYSSILAILMVTSFTFAQDSLVNKNMPSIGDSLPYGSMQAPVIDYGLPSSSPQVWDFSTLEADLAPFAMEFRPNSEAANAGSFPTANMFATNLVFRGGGFEFFTDNHHYRNEDTLITVGYYMEGFAPFTPWASQPVYFMPPDTFLFKGVTYGDTIVEEHKTQIKLIDTDAAVDSFYTYHDITTDYYDAYGTVVTPWNTYEVLRVLRKAVRRDSTRIDSVLGGDSSYSIAGSPSNFGGSDDVGIDSNYTVHFVALDSTNSVGLNNFISVFGVVNISIDEFGIPLGANFIQGPTADFVFTPAVPNLGDTIQFIDASFGNAANHTWDFDDGVGTSKAEDTVYLYTTADTFFVSLTVSNKIGSNTNVKKVIVKEPNGVRTLEVLSEVSVFPNPSAEMVNIFVKKAIAGQKTLEVYNLNGQKVFVSNSNTEHFKIVTSEYASGLYSFKVLDDQKSLISQGKFIVKN